MNPEKRQFPEVVAVEASAGSGKTYALARRYLSLLLSDTRDFNPSRLKAILAITFTNKAAVEMKQRILEFLRRIAFDDFIDQAQRRDVLAAAGNHQNAKTKALAAMDEILLHYSFFQVQTIDSFINTILLGSSLSIERSASFKIRRDYGAFFSYCFDAAVDLCARDKEALELFNDFLEHYLFVDNRLSWFPRENILKLVNSLFQMSNYYGEPFASHTAAGSDVLKAKIAVYTQIKVLAQNLPEGLNAACKKSIVNFIADNSQFFDIDALPKRFTSPEPPLNKGVEVSGDFLRGWRSLHEEIKALVELEADSAYNPYVKLFEYLTRIFKEVSRKEDMIFLEELNRKARLVFDEEGATVAEIYYRLALRFKHYLIDEFQDTSRLQWRNLHLMVEDALSSGGSLFYVGDKKQAIYRFRGGDARLFDEVKKEFVHFNVKEERLNKNWRSSKAIVEFNNAVFAPDNLSRFFIDSKIDQELTAEKLDEIKDVFKDSFQAAARESRGCVSVERIAEDNLAARNDVMRGKVVALVKELSSRFDPGDISVLARDNNEVELVTGWLIEAGIAAQSDKTLNVLAESLIKELTAFLHFLRSPIDDLNFCAFICGEIFAKGAKLPARSMHDFIFKLHCEDKVSDGGIYIHFRKAYPELWKDLIEVPFKSVGFVSPYEVLVDIYRRFRLCEFTGKEAFFSKFLELVKIKEDELTGLDELLNYFEDPLEDELYVSAAKGSAIHVLTVHKAKGLEFGAVILPFFRMEIKPSHAVSGARAHVEDEEADELKLVRVIEAYRAYSPRLNAIYRRDYFKAALDELNSLYVALTRAKDEMYIFIPEKSGAGFNKAAKLIGDNVTVCGEKKAAGLKKCQDENILSIAPLQYENWTSVFKEEFGDPAQVLMRGNILEGSILHFMLSRVGNLCENDPGMILQEAALAAQEKFRVDMSAHRKNLESIVNNPDFKDFFYVDKGEVFCEKEFCTQMGDLKRADRVLVRQKEVWIIEYKSAPLTDDTYIKQVHSYMDAARQVYDNKKVRAFLLYFNPLRKEEVDG
jgi:ATP-dependent exoDNAse (exonuclease V) beta subunit